MGFNLAFKGLNAELNPICHLLALLGAHHILHVSRIRVKEHLYYVTSRQMHIKYILTYTRIKYTNKCIYLFAQYNQQDATFHNLFISVRRSTCFRRFFSVHHQELKTAHTASGILLPVANLAGMEPHVERLTEIKKL